MMIRDSIYLIELQHIHTEQMQLKCATEMLRVFEAKAKLKMLTKECESEMYVREKEKYEMFLKHVKTKCKSEMQK